MADKDLSADIIAIDLGLTQAAQSLTDALQALEDITKEVQKQGSTIQNLITKCQEFGEKARILGCVCLHGNI